MRRTRTVTRVGLLVAVSGLLAFSGTNDAGFRPGRLPGVSAVMATTTTTAAATSSAWNGKPKPWAAENEAASHDWTRDQAVDHAGKFDGLLSITRSYKGDTSAMKQTKPNLLIFHYVSGTHAGKTQTGIPEPWYLKDAQGRKVVSRSFDTYLMNPAEPGWVQSRIDLCKSEMARSGYDSCYLDGLATWALTDVTAPPINPKTGNQYTKTEFLSATTALAKKVNDAVARPLIGSGGFTGRHYFGGESQLLNGLDRIVVEGFCRNPKGSMTTYYSVENWKQDVDMLKDAEAKGGSVMTLTKTWADGSAQAKENWHRYCLATFLLGTNGASQFGFTWNKGDAASASSPLWSTTLGAPKGTYAFTEGVYQRTFSAGRVLVNPGGGTVTVNLGGTYTRAADGKSVTSMTMPPHSGELLLKK